MAAASVFADKLAKFLAEHDRAAIFTGLNAAVVFYAHTGEAAISFISDPESLHILATTAASDLPADSAVALNPSGRLDFSGASGGVAASASAADSAVALNLSGRLGFSGASGGVTASAAAAAQAGANSDSAAGLPDSPDAGAIDDFGEFPPAARSKITGARTLHARAPVSLAIFSQNHTRGISAKARLRAASAAEREEFLRRYKSARFAINHQIYTLEIVYAKFKSLLPPARWEYFAAPATDAAADAPKRP